MVILFFRTLVVLLVVVACQGISVHFFPSTIRLDQVSLQYPVTLARKLFSSVPRREFAVDRVTCQFSSEIVLLQGASSSGKTALMKVILGQEKATTGSVTIQGGAKPVLLADKPPFDNQRSVRAILESKAQRLGKETAGLCANIFSRLVQLEESLWEKTPADLSPSENYRLRLAEACLQSSLTEPNQKDEKSMLLPAPIILLDEWMDFETRDSSSKVEDALLNIVQSTGAVIFCATHKPNLWKKLESLTPHTTQMTMCRGQILTLKQTEATIL